MDTKNILVCVTQQKTCERLINEAHELVNEYRGKLFIINVVKNDLNFLDSDNLIETQRLNNQQEIMLWARQNGCPLP